MKRLIYERHTEILNERMDAMLESLRAVVDDGFPAAQQSYKEEVTKWGKLTLHTVSSSGSIQMTSASLRGKAKATSEAGKSIPIILLCSSVEE